MKYMIALKPTMMIYLAQAKIPKESEKSPW